MNELPATSKTPVAAVPILTSFLLAAICVAGYFGYTSHSQSEEIVALQGQVEDAEKQIANLQPLAQKARQLPIATRINRHAANAGNNLVIFNRARDSLRLNIAINAGGRVKNVIPVVDGGRMYLIRSLAPGDSVAISADGYDTTTVPIEVGP